MGMGQPAEEFAAKAHWPSEHSDVEYVPEDYRLTPTQLKQAYGLYLLDGAFLAGGEVYFCIVLFLLVQQRVGAKLRDWAQHSSRWPWVQALLVAGVFTVLLRLFGIPLDILEHRVSLRYGFSVQHWGSWLADWWKATLLTAAFIALLGWGAYAIIRRSPRRCWFYAWLLTLPVMVLVMFVAPVLIEPLFNHYEPLEKTHPELVAQIERVVRRAGMEIPPERMFLMRASEKVTTLNADVEGMGSTKRVVVWDTTISHLNSPQLLFVFGHEIGHYVLGHIWKEMALIAVQLLVLFYVAFRLANGLLRHYGERWHVAGLGDWASLPLIILLLTMLAFLDSPVVNGVSRHYEHQADTYGLNVIQDIVAEPNVVAAQAFQVLGERSLDYPYVSKWAEFWAWDHPPIRERLLYALHYQP